MFFTLLKAASVFERLFFRTTRVVLSTVAYSRLFLSSGLRKKFLSLEHYSKAAGRDFRTVMHAIIHYELRGAERNLELSPHFSKADYFGANQPIFLVRPISPFVEFLLRGGEGLQSQNRYFIFTQRTPLRIKPDSDEDKVKVGIYSAIIDGHDAPAPLPLNQIRARFPTLTFDYRVYTDMHLNGIESATQLFPPFYCDDPKRVSGWLKTHPHFLFEGFDYVIWFDGNLEVTTEGLAEIVGLIDVNDQNFHIATYPHPRNNSVYEECMNILRSGRDDPGCVVEHLERYGKDLAKKLGPLLETRVFIWNLKSTEQLAKVWWREIANGSKRDQVSLPFALRNANITPLYIEGADTPPRDSKHFRVLDHLREYRK